MGDSNKSKAAFLELLKDTWAAAWHLRCLITNDTTPTTIPNSAGEVLHDISTCLERCIEYMIDSTT